MWFKRLTTTNDINFDWIIIIIEKQLPVIKLKTRTIEILIERADVTFFLCKYKKKQKCQPPIFKNVFKNARKNRIIIKYEFKNAKKL